jgi:conjugal transfer pilus assembly protein TraD
MATNQILLSRLILNAISTVLILLLFINRGYLFLPFFIVSLFVFIARLDSYLRYQAKNNTLSGTKLEFITSTELKSLMKPNEVYLGRGFLWQKDHAQQSADILEHYASVAHVSLNPNIRGLQFMQGLSNNDEIHVKLDFLNGHTLITGTTGAGKTRLFDLLIAQAILREECVIIVDPKGDRDLCNHAKEICAQLDSRPFAYFHPGFPEQSISINPLFNFNRATELASRIASLIPTAKGTNDPFKSFSQLALNTVIGALLLMGMRPSLKNIRYYVDSRLMELCFLAFKYYFDKYMPNRYQDEWLALAQSTSKVPGKLLSNYNLLYLKALKKNKPSMELEGLYALSRHDSSHYGKMIGSLISVLDMLTLGELGSLLSPATEITYATREWDFSRLIAKSRVVYVGLDSLTDNIVGAALGSLFLADLTAVAGARYNYSPSITPVNLFIDESAEVISDELIQLLNKGRGAGFRITLATQTIADFEARLGSKAKALQVLGNVNNAISLRVIDNDTKEYVADLFPKVRIHYHNHSSSQNQSTDELLKVSTSISETLTEQEVSIFPPELLSDLPDLEFVAKVGGSMLYKGKLPFIGVEK